MFSCKDKKLRVKNNAAVKIREIEFSIRIKDKDSSFTEMLGILREELTPFRKIARHNLNSSDNATRDFIQTNIERSIVIRENTRVYFLDYKEREASQRISFSILIITKYIQYASLRQELDSLVKDTIADYFEEIIERYVPVSITVEVIDNEIVSLSESGAEVKTARLPKRDALTWLTALISLVISVAFSFFIFMNLHLKTENTKLKEDYIDMVLKKKIEEAVKDQEFTVKLYRIDDTLGSSPKIISVPPAK